MQFVSGYLRRRNKLKQKIVGSYFAGYESVELILREGSGGDIDFIEKGCVAKMRLGGDQDWPSCFTALFHEIFELVFDRIKCRFDPSNDISRSASSYLFVANHVAFSDVCAKSAEFVDLCLLDLKKAYKLWNRKEK